jgi:hypothetical protein
MWNVRVDEAGGEDAAAGVVDPGLRALHRRKRAGRLHDGDAARLHPDLAGGVDTLGVGGEEAGAGDDEVGCLAAHGHGGERAGDGVQRRDGKAGEGHAVNLSSADASGEAFLCAEHLVLFPARAGR